MHESAKYVMSDIYKNIQSSNEDSVQITEPRPQNQYLVHSITSNGSIIKSSYKIFAMLLRGREYSETETWGILPTALNIPDIQSNQ